MVSGRAGDYTLPFLLWCQVSHLVVGTTELKAEDGKEILTLEEDLALETVGQVNGMVEWCLFNNIVYPRR